MALLFAMAGTPAPVGDPPAGDPSGMGVTVYGADYWRVLWVNGDVAAYTRIYRGAIGSAWAQSTQAGVAQPGETSLDTGIDAGNFQEITETPDDYRFFARHFRNGVLSGTAHFDTTFF